MSWSGHFWTIAPHLKRRLLRQDVAQAEDWSCRVPDERHGVVNLSGRFTAAAAATELLIVVHGLGGSSESGYAVAASQSAVAAGLACLRLNQRGADQRGEDFYHAGLWQDLDVVVTDPTFERFDSIFLLGYSLGGQLCLHWAAKGNLAASRVRGVAAVCPPLDPSRTVSSLDSSRNVLYRSHVIGGLKKAYRAVAARREVPLPIAEANRISKLRDWDGRITAPRHGFRDAEHYYTETSAGRCLRNVACPALLVVSEQDPMIPIGTVEPALHDVSSHVVVKRVAQGGHVGFPADLSLEQPGLLGLEQQLITWLRSERRKRSRPSSPRAQSITAALK